MLGLARRARVQQNEVVLITAAAGGLGLAAVDIAANVYKTKVRSYDLIYSSFIHL